ncbi:MAG: ABC transporter permease [Actinobacteria bacterium]|nr:MAG: ABC transporter permease [Actinomycetota bacterium]
MRRFLLTRIGLALITLVLVSIMVFAVSQLLPGDVGRTILGPYATNAQVASLDHELGVDKPLLVRYKNWIVGFVQGDWGQSALLNQPVRPVVLHRLANSLMLGGFALVLIVPFSILMGVLAALHYGKTVDRLISVTGLSLIALPEFVAGVILLVLFAVKVQWFPVSSSVPKANPVDWFRQFLLPSIPLMLVLFGYISRMARAGTVDALLSNYTRTAVLKGLPRRTVIWRHVLRNALLPTISVVSVQVGYLVGGLVVIETLFNYPGIGKLTLDSAIGHDLQVLESTVLMIAVLYMVTNLVADVLYGILNPRVRLASS